MNSIQNPKRIAKNTLMLYIRMLMVMGVALYTSRIVLQELGVENYGIYNVVGGIVVMFSFLNGAMAQSTQRFLSFEIGKQNNARLEKTFKTAVTIHVIIGLIILLLAESLGLWFLNQVMTIPASKISAANWVFQCSILSYVISIFQVPFNASIIAREKMNVYAYVGIIEVLMKLGVAFSLMLFSGQKLKFYAILVLIVTIIISIILQVYCRYSFKECKVKLLWDKEMLRSMSGFAAWSTLGSLAWAAKNQGCNIILNIFFGPAVNAAYGISGQVNVAINNFVQNFSTAVNPQIVKSYSVEAYIDMQRLITYGAKLAFFLMLLLSFPILMTTSRILNIWLVKVPEYAVVFTQLIIINSLIESFSYSMGAGIQATGKIKWYQILVGGTFLLSLPISYILLRVGLSPIIVFIVNITLSSITILERMLILKRNIPMFSVKKLLRVVFVPAILISILCILFYLCFSAFPDLVNINTLVVIIISIAWVAIWEYIIGFNKSEKQLLWRFLQKKFQRGQKEY